MGVNGLDYVFMDIATYRCINILSHHDAIDWTLPANLFRKVEMDHGTSGSQFLSFSMVTAVVNVIQVAVVWGRAVVISIQSIPIPAPIHCNSIYSIPNKFLSIQFIN